MYRITLTRSVAPVVTYHDGVFRAGPPRTQQVMFEDGQIVLQGGGTVQVRPIRNGPVVLRQLDPGATLPAALAAYNDGNLHLTIHGYLGRRRAIITNAAGEYLHRNGSVFSSTWAEHVIDSRGHIEGTDRKITRIGDIDYIDYNEEFLSTFADDDNAPPSSAVTVRYLGFLAVATPPARPRTFPTPSNRPVYGVLQSVRNGMHLVHGSGTRLDADLNDNYGVWLVPDGAIRGTRLVFDGGNIRRGDNHWLLSDRCHDRRCDLEWRRGAPPNINHWSFRAIAPPASPPSPPPPPPPSPPDEDGGGDDGPTLASEVIAGIVVGCIAFCILAIAVARSFSA